MHTKERELQEKLKIKTDEVHDLHKKLKKTQADFDMALQKSHQAEQYFNQKIAAEEAINKLK